MAGFRCIKTKARPYPHSEARTSLQKKQTMGEKNSDRKGLILHALQLTSTIYHLNQSNPSMSQKVPAYSASTSSKSASYLIRNNSKAQITISVGQTHPITHHISVGVKSHNLIRRTSQPTSRPQEGKEKKKSEARIPAPA